MDSPEALLTPKELAAAVGASESSLRRWIDSGEVRVSRTAGGHRRIPLSEAIRFIRAMGAVVVRPEVLNLPGVAEATSAAGAPGESDEERLFAALAEGKRDVARGLTSWWYLQGQSLPSLFDGPVRGAMHRLGELWKHDERGILIEHRASTICAEMIVTLRALLPAVDASAPLAMGAAPQGDPYQIPSLMAATVLAEAGMRDVNFGADTPLELLADEAIHCGARLVWLSISSVTADRVKALRGEVKSLADALAAHQIAVVIGGSASVSCIPRAAGNVQAVGSMGELAAYARGLLGRAPVAR